MRKLRFHTEDSMDLLLDTLCDVFGSIILISCLLALVGNAGPAGDSKTEGAAVAARREAMERRLDAAEQELRGLHELHLKLGKDDNGVLTRLVAERDALRKTQERLRADRAAPEPEATKPQTGASAEDVEKLRREVREAERMITDAGIQKNAAELTERELLARLEKLKRLLQEQEEGRHVEYVRFPKERDTSKKPLNLILKHGEVFPLYDAAGQRFSGLTWIEKDAEEHSFSVEPQSGHGLRMGRDLTVLRQVLAAGKRAGLFANVYLFPDSFEQMRGLRPLMQEAGLEFGFEILPQHYMLVFSPKGTTLKPL